MMQANLSRFPGCLVIYTVFSIAAVAQEDPVEQVDNGQPQTIDEKTKGMQKHDGFIPFYWDEETGSIFLEID